MKNYQNLDTLLSHKKIIYVFLMDLFCMEVKWIKIVIPGKSFNKIHKKRTTLMLAFWEIIKERPGIDKVLILNLGKL